MGSQVAQFLGLKPDGTKLDLVGANQQPLRSHGYADVELILSIGPVRKITTTGFAVVDDLCTDVLLGCELLG